MCVWQCDKHYVSQVSRKSRAHMPRTSCHLYTKHTYVHAVSKVLCDAAAMVVLRWVHLRNFRHNSTVAGECGSQVVRAPKIAPAISGKSRWSLRFTIISMNLLYIYIHISTSIYVFIWLHIMYMCCCILVGQSQFFKTGSVAKSAPERINRCVLMYYLQLCACRYAAQFCLLMLGLY